MEKKAISLDHYTEIFSQEFDLLPGQLKIAFFSLLKNFPNPTPFSELSLNLGNSPDYFLKQDKNKVERIIGRIRTVFREHGCTLSIAGIDNYGYEITHPDLKRTWWSQISKQERKILSVIFKSEIQPTYLDLYYTFNPGKTTIPTNEEINNIHLVISRLSSKLESILGVEFTTSPASNLEKIWLIQNMVEGGKHSLLDDLQRSLAESN